MMMIVVINMIIVPVMMIIVWIPCAGVDNEGGHHSAES